ncbi:MAG: alanine racemase [Treponema sp.]|uniref:alanine racemase n=1 Tax=Treponema sp. TaxID=166 RepID=UPI003FA22B81
MRATKAIIHLDNLEYNIKQIKQRLAPHTKICLPVKADAYGHGAVRTAIAAIRAGVSYLAVASVQEGIELREAGIVAPIISLSLPILEEIDSIIEYKLEPLVIDESFINELNRTAEMQRKTVAVHLKIDTGMSRIGCKPSEAVKLATQIVRAKHLRLQGVATHFAVADSETAENRNFTRQQFERFTDAVTSIRNTGITIPIVHAANSGAVQAFPDAQFDMVRPGLLAYGYHPLKRGAASLDVKPVMELITQVVLIKQIRAGTSVSYGRDWTAAEDTYIATLPIGYADGLRRALSPGLKVRIGNEFFPIVGKICMDQCMIDLGSKPWVQRWDEVHIFGTDTRDNTAQTLADIAGTIPYEITCGIHKRVPRVFINECR